MGQAGTLLKVLLVCGIVASVLHFATDLFAGMMWTGYNFVSQSISELSALGSPTRSLVLSLDLVSGFLMIAFGLGIWLVSGHNVALRITAVLVIGNAVVSIVAEAFFPPRYGETLGTNTSVANVGLMAVGMVLFLLAIAFGAAAFHGWFRVFSIGILVAYGVLTVVGLLIRRPPTPSGPAMQTVGIQERTMMYSYLLWLAILAVVLLRRGGDAGPITVWAS
jgi:hypothetical protein